MKTGKAVWTFTTRARVDSSPIVAGNRVYIGGNDGKLYVLDAGPARASSSSKPADFKNKKKEKGGEETQEEKNRNENEGEFLSRAKI